jgi:6-pyruvoyl-tetrahydropterin synthase
VELLADELKDKMVAYLRRLIALIKEATSPWDNSKLADKLGLTGLVNDLETVVATCDVTEIAYDASWLDSRGILAQTKVHDCLAKLGMKNADDRARLMRHVSTG